MFWKLGYSNDLTWNCLNRAFKSIKTFPSTVLPIYRNRKVVCCTLNKRTGSGRTETWEMRETSAVLKKSRLQITASREYSRLEVNNSRRSFSRGNTLPSLTRSLRSIRSKVQFCQSSRPRNTFSCA